jgi:hypothetical protein
VELCRTSIAIEIVHFMNRTVSGSWMLRRSIIDELDANMRPFKCVCKLFGAFCLLSCSDLLNSSVSMFSIRVMKLK